MTAVRASWSGSLLFQATQEGTILDNAGATHREPVTVARQRPEHWLATPRRTLSGIDANSESARGHVDASFPHTPLQC